MVADSRPLVAAAAKSKSDKDYESLFQALGGVELFLNISDQTGPRGASESIETHLTTPLVDVGNGLKAVILYTASNSPKLKKPFGGLPRREALEMVVRMPQADGLVIESPDHSWVAIDKKKATSLLNA